MFLNLDQAKNLFNEIIEEINNNMDAIRSCNFEDENAEQQLFTDVMAPIIIMIEGLREGFLWRAELNLSLDNIDFKSDGLAIMTFCVLSKNIQLWEIFDYPDEFLDAFKAVPGMQLVVDELLDEDFQFPEDITLKDVVRVL